MATAGENTTTTDYANGYVYQDGDLEFFGIEEGRMLPGSKPGEFKPEGFLRDLPKACGIGDIREVCKKQTGGVAILHVGAKRRSRSRSEIGKNHYYPFGLTMGALNYTATIENRYKFNGKELENESGLQWYDYGFRRYDPQIGRWHVIDPHAENRHNYSPYAYVLNNPVRYTDPFGLDEDDEEAEDSGGGGKLGPRGLEITNNIGRYPYRPPSWGELDGIKRRFGPRKDYPGPRYIDFKLYYILKQNGATSKTLHEWYKEGNRAESSTVEGEITITEERFACSFNPKDGEYGYDILPLNVYYYYVSTTCSINLEVSFDNLSNIGYLLTVAGTLTDIIKESYFLSGNKWRGANGKWYSLKWWGNQWSGTRANVLSKAGYLKLASRWAFVAGTVISGYQGYYAYQNGDYAGVAKSGLDIGMGAFATFGGFPGWVIGGGYLLLDALGVYSSPNITSPNRDYIYFPLRDNTNIVKYYFSE